MKYKIIYKRAPLYMEIEADNEQERKEAIKGIIRATKDLGEENLLSPVETSQSVAENIVSEPIKEAPHPATRSQRDFMIKLKIPFENDIDYIEADKLIKEGKARLGYK